MEPEEANDDEITYIRDLLSELAEMATARGDRILAYLIAMAWLHAWEVERKLAQRQGEKKVNTGLSCILLASAIAF